jgi:Ni/Fe-hydrogenase subunit HybB-like protein
VACYQCDPQGEERAAATAVHCDRCHKDPVPASSLIHVKQYIAPFTAFYSNIPEHGESLRYMFTGIDGHTALVPWMWSSMVLGAGALVLLLVPRFRHNQRLPAWACGMVFFSLWLDKGIGLIVAAFVPSPLGAVTDYVPSLHEVLIALGVWAIGTLILTVLYRIVISVRAAMTARCWW